MKNTKILLASIIVVSLLNFSCSKDDADTQAPVISINDPINDEIFLTGNELHIDVDLTDNVALASYKIDIHYNGDGHSHGPKFSSQADEVAWEHESEGSLSGRTQNLHLDFPIPANAKHGEYHLGVFAIDQSGNQSQRFIDIVIE